jgi:hypothetical protein
MLAEQLADVAAVRDLEHGSPSDAIVCTEYPRSGNREESATGSGARGENDARRVVTCR